MTYRHCLRLRFLRIGSFQNRPKATAIFSPAQETMGRIGTAPASRKLPANRLLLLDFSLPGSSGVSRFKGDMISTD